MRRQGGTKRGHACVAGLTAAIASIAGLLANPPEAAATGYTVGHESVSGMGVAYAGGAAAATDVSTVFYNPAGMTRIDGNQVMFGSHLILPYIDFEDRNSRLFDGTPISGGEGGDGGEGAVVPHLYAVYSAPHAVKLGLGINSPYGLVTDYDIGWQGRYNEITTSLKSVNFNLAAARPFGRLSVGAGASVQYLRGKLIQAIDFGSSCARALGAGTCSGTFGLEPGADDGRGAVTGDTFGYGFNVGLLYELNEDTRFGAHYRSRMYFDFDAEGDFDVPANARAFLNAAGLPNAFNATPAQFSLVEPETVSVSGWHALNDKWAVMADVTWTGWSSFYELRIEFDNQTPTNLLPTDWNDVFRYSAGVTYQWSDKTVLRGGVAYAESPIDDDFRGPGIPDSDRKIVGLGIGHALTDSLWVDAGYQYLLFDTGITRRVSPTASVLDGEFHVDVHAVGVALTWKF